MMTLTDDQRMLADSVAPFMADEGAIAKQLRHWRDIGCKDGFGHGLWKQFAELGLTGILIPEAQGGAGLGMVEAGVVLEEIGRNLTPSPFLTTAVAAVRALEGSAQAERWFPGIVAGDTVAALAIDEGRHHGPASIAMAAKRSGNGFALNGTKQFISNAQRARVAILFAVTDSLTLVSSTSNLRQLGVAARQHQQLRGISSSGSRACRSRGRARTPGRAGRRGRRRRRPSSPHG